MPSKSLVRQKEICGLPRPWFRKKQGEEPRPTGTLETFETTETTGKPSNHRLPLLFQLALTLPVHNLLGPPTKSQPGDCRPFPPQALRCVHGPGGRASAGRASSHPASLPASPGSGGQQVFGPWRGSARPVPRPAAPQSCSERRAVATLYSLPARGARGRPKCGVGNSFAALPPTRSLFSTSEKCRALGSVFLFIPY